MISRLITRLLVACFIAALSSQALANEKVVIASAAPVLGVGQASNSGIPKCMGYWAQQGIDVDVVPGHATAQLQAMLGGKADIYYGGPSRAFVAMQKGAHIKGIYLNVRKNIYWPIVLAGSPIKTIADLKGKTLGVASYASQLNVIMKGAMREAGLDPNKDVNIVAVGVGPQAFAALRNHQIDAYATYDTQVAGAENHGLKVRRLESPFFKNLRLGAWYMVRDQYLKTHRDTLVKVLRGIAEGAVFMYANPKAAIEAHWSVYPNVKPTGVSNEVAMRQALNTMHWRAEGLKREGNVKWGEIPRVFVSDYLDFLMESKQLNRKPKVDSTYTNKLIAAVNDFDSAKIDREAKDFHGCIAK